MRDELRCGWPENGGGGHVDYCKNLLPCVEHLNPPTRAPRPRPTLFKVGVFTGASGRDFSWKIECDALTDEDWDALAYAASVMLPSYRDVVGVPTGGTTFANCLRTYVSGRDRDPLLIADDVWSTGKSMSEHAATLDLNPHDWIGVVAFARGPIPVEWVNSKVWPIFTLNHSDLPATALERVQHEYVPTEAFGFDLGICEICQQAKRDPLHGGS